MAARRLSHREGATRNRQCPGPCCPAVGRDAERHRPIAGAGRASRHCDPRRVRDGTPPTGGRCRDRHGRTCATGGADVLTGWRNRRITRSRWRSRYARLAHAWALVGHGNRPHASLAWIGRHREADPARSGPGRRGRERDPPDLGHGRPRAPAVGRDGDAACSTARVDTLARRGDFVAAGRALDHARLLAVHDDHPVARGRSLVGGDPKRHLRGTLPRRGRQRRDPAHVRGDVPCALGLRRDAQRTTASVGLHHWRSAERYDALDRARCVAADGRGGATR